MILIFCMNTIITIPFVKYFHQLLALRIQSTGSEGERERERERASEGKMAEERAAV
jgi:hypothetical protein